MSAGETIVICQICQHENEPDQRFCDECGVELSSVEAEEVVPETGNTLAAGAVLLNSEGQEVVVGSVASLGRLNRYRCRFGGDEGMLLEESASAAGFLESRLSTLKSLEDIPGLWYPDQIFHFEDRSYASGKTPDFPTLEARIKQDGALNAEQLRALAKSLGRLISEIHERSFLARSFHPSRLWWDGDAELVVENLDRMVRSDASGEDFQVVNGFSPPEAYGVGASTVGIPGDLYSAGAVLHFAASGHRTDLESRENFFNFPPLRELDDAVMRGAIERLTAKNVAHRLGTAEELLGFLEQTELPAPVPSAAPERKETPMPGRMEAPVLKSAGASAVVGNNGAAECDYDIYLQSHVGCVRSINQDACLKMRFTSIEKSQPSETHLLVMVDGMGGEAEGDKAASLALRTIAQEVVGSNLTLNDQRATSPLLPATTRERNMFLLERALKKANRTIFDYAERDIGRRGMGCTITSCLLEANEVTIGHVGDTRAYMWRQGTLTRLTTDHSLVGRLVEMGQLTEEEARNSPQRSIIYRAMGTNPDVEVDLYHQDLQPGDRLMVSSDGVWEYFTNDELEAIMGVDESPESIANRLVDICLSRGADDNATLAVVFAVARNA